MKEILMVFEDLQKMVPHAEIAMSEPLSKHTFIKTGGIGDVFIKPTEVNELQKNRKIRIRS